MVRLYSNTNFWFLVGLDHANENGQKYGDQSGYVSAFLLPLPHSCWDPLLWEDSPALVFGLDGLLIRKGRHTPDVL